MKEYCCVECGLNYAADFESWPSCMKLEPQPQCSHDIRQCGPECDTHNGFSNTQIGNEAPHKFNQQYMKAAHAGAFTREQVFDAGYELGAVDLELYKGELTQAKERIKELEREVEHEQQQYTNGLAFLREVSEERDRYKAALEKIAEDFGTDFADGHTLIAEEALREERG